MRGKKLFAGAALAAATFAIAIVVTQSADAARGGQKTFADSLGRTWVNNAKSSPTNSPLIWSTGTPRLNCCPSGAAEDTDR